MRNILKKAAAAVLAVAMCLTFAGCYDENKTWAAKMGDETMPIGGYIYYLSSAYSEARAKAPSDQEVLKATIEEKDAETWIKDRAMEYLMSFYYVSTKFEDLGLELTEDELSAVSQDTTGMWSYLKSSMESIGIAQDSFNMAASLYNARYEKVRNALYGKGGEMEISEDEFRTYFTENYYNYEYFYVPLSTTDDEGNSTDLTDEEKEEAKKKLEEYVDSIGKGPATVEEAAAQYAKENSEDSETTNYSTNVSLKDNLTATIKEALDGIEENEVTFAETANAYYVIRKLPIADKFSENYEDETQLNSMISGMKNEEFRDYVREQGKSVEGVEVNKKAIDSIRVSHVVNDSIKNGTSSEGEDTSSASSEAE